MNINLLLLAFGLFSWGYLVNSLLIASGLLLLFMLVQSSVWRWTIAAKQLHRWGDVSTLLVVLLLIQTYLLQPVEQPMFVLLKCLPIVLAPVLLAQFLSRQPDIPLSTLFYALRRKNRSSDQHIDFVLPYSALTIVSAGAANVQDYRYFSLATLFFGLVLLLKKPKQSPLLLWLLVMSLAITVGFFGQKGLRQLHHLVEQQSIKWLSEWQTDPFKSQTSIGDLGELKLSNQIEFRIRADGQLLLHQASYDRYLGQTWLASKRSFSTENPNSLTKPSALKRLEVLQQAIGQTVLALPDGTVNIVGLDPAVLHYSELGVIKVDSPERKVNYQVFYTGQRLGKVGQYDLQIPAQHKDWLETVSRELKLTGLPPKVIAERIKDYFQANFFYSLYLGSEANPDIALRTFMLNRKAGHCEYFAAATVLLLRQAGIPARLATGYSVSEYVPEQDVYLVRRRDAHAWAIAYLNGVWQAVDSTPAQWQQMEANHAQSIWQTLSDVWSNTLFLLQSWQISEQHALQLKLASLIALLLYIAIRYRPRQQKSGTKTPVYAGLDSEFYLLEQSLQNTPLARQHHESLQQWVTRLNFPELHTLCRLHYQLRFDPQGLQSEQRQQLRQGVQTFMRLYQQTP